MHQSLYSGVVSKNAKDWSFYFCRSCGQPVAAGGPHATGGKIDTIIPQPRAVDTKVPIRPRDYLQQALDTFHAPSASIMVSASAVDAMLKEKGLATGTLYSRIDEAAEKRLITSDMAAWAHDVRLDANYERHADDERGTPSSADAARAFDFAAALAEYLFVLPARIAEGRRAASG